MLRPMEREGPAQDSRLGAGPASLLHQLSSLPAQCSGPWASGDRDRGALSSHLSGPVCGPGRSQGLQARLLRRLGVEI